MIDDSAYPLVHVVWPADDVDDAFVDGFLARFNEVLTRGPKVDVLADCRSAAASPLNRALIERFAAWFKTNGAQMSGKIRVALVLPPASAAREGLAQINLRAPPPYVRRVFTDVDTAQRWLVT
jgi:hypothetical protein